MPSRSSRSISPVLAHRQSSLRQYTHWADRIRSASVSEPTILGRFFKASRTACQNRSMTCVPPRTDTSRPDPGILCTNVRVNFGRSQTKWAPSLTNLPSLASRFFFFMRYWLLTLCEEDIYLGVDRWAEQLLRLFEKADTRGQESQVKFRPKR